MSVELFLNNDSVWPGRYFAPAEFQCHHCGKLLVDPMLLTRLDRMREKLGRPLQVLSGYRCHAHNLAVGGATHSYHVAGRAVDLRAGSVQEQIDIIAEAKILGFGGVGLYENFVHLDLGPERAWRG